MNVSRIPSSTPRWSVFVVALAVAFVALAQAPVICGSCGREAVAGETVCSHCQAPLPVAAATAAAPAAKPAGALDSSVAELARKAAQDCVLAGRRQHQSGRPDVAKVLYANALSIAGLDPSVLTPAQGEKLQEELRECDGVLSTIRAECPACQGTGRRSLQVTSLGGGSTGAQTSAVSSGIRCDVCGGTGKRLRRRTVGERKTALGQGAQAAETAFRALGFVQEGNAWIPQELVPLLDIVQRCRLRRAAAAPCSSCQGFGLVDCKKCGSTGYVPCKAKGCENGWIIDEPLNRLDSKSAAIKTRKPCPVCKGTAQVPCQTCAGRGAQTCTKCEGSGRRGLCNSCGGEGIAACAACRGTGETRATSKAAATPCPVCNGTGKGFCKTCHGDGYGR